MSSVMDQSPMRKMRIAFDLHPVRFGFTEG
jgi:hypothetical protein